MIKENELYKRIDEILQYIWDPIGISGCPGARDEYNSYIPEIYELLSRNNAKEEITKTLNRIQNERMGLKSDIKHCAEVADIIIDWSDFLK